jgi:prepilin-type N-terminal cleavage/methylation domain-containing protein
MTRKKLLKAFSLIEISMVILIIGILILGISSGLDLYYDSRVSSAKSLTQNSRVRRIPDLMLWFDSVSSNVYSIDSDFKDKIEIENNIKISKWKDLSLEKNHSVQANSDYQPVFQKNSINNIHSLYFDGINDFLEFSGNFLIGKNYTIFAVEKKKDCASNKNCSIIGGVIEGVFNSNSHLLNFGYYGSDKIRYSNYHSQINLFSEFSFSKNNQPNIHNIIFTSEYGFIYWINNLIQVSDYSKKTPLALYSKARIAQKQTEYYNGNIGEIIIFDRNLTEKERFDVTEYLSKKWAIATDKTLYNEIQVINNNNNNNNTPQVSDI